MNLFKRPKQPKLLIRWVIGRDLPEILGIEHESFEFPSREVDFIRLLERRDCIGIVADANDHIAGYMIYERNRAASTCSIWPSIPNAAAPASARNSWPSSSPS